ncbi:MAG: hypothetical protein LBC44_03495, partial [Mycoplasmataceae bacterium]|nr:hypothetical protein [Mycoplasmataceae bacterium]
SQKYKYIVIDTAPAFDDLSWELMDLANLVCIPYSCKGYANEAVSDMVNSESLKDFRMNNKNLGICIIPNRYKVIARKGEESKNSSYKILLDDIKEKIKTFKNVFVSNLISYSDQYDTAMQFEQVPLTLANPSKLNRNLKAYAKPIEEQKELSKTIIKLLGGKK